MQSDTEQRDDAGDPTSGMIHEGEPTTPLSLFGTIWYSLANLGYGAFFSFNNAILPLFLKSYTSNAILLGLMGSTHSVEGVVIQPIVGTLSDRTRSRWGRRRPYILPFTLLSAFFLVLTPPVSHLPASIRLGAIVAAVFLFTVFFNIASDPYQALMPDITPVSQRGRVTAVLTFLGVLGQAGIVFIPLPDRLFHLKFYIVATLMVVTALLTCALIRESKTSQSPTPTHSHIEEIREAIGGLAILNQAERGIAAFFLSGLGVSAVMPFLTLFVQKITGCTNHQAEGMFMVLMISTAAAVLPMGWLTDRIGAKAMLMIALSLICFASLNGLWVSTLSQIKVILIIAGVGNAAQSAASYPLMTQLVPAEEVGFYTGLQTMALSIAQPLTVFVTGSMINHGSYRAIFGVCALSMVLALFVLAGVSRRQADIEIEARNRQQGRTA